MDSTYEPDEQLPQKITRRCCLYKPCTTSLYLSREAVLDSDSPTGASVQFTYRRVSNDDIFWGPDTETGLRERLVDPDYFPDSGGTGR